MLTNSHAVPACVLGIVLHCCYPTLQTMLSRQLDCQANVLLYCKAVLHCNIRAVGEARQAKGDAKKEINK